MSLINLFLQLANFIKDLIKYTLKIFAKIINNQVLIVTLFLYFSTIRLFFRKQKTPTFPLGF